MRTIWLSQNFPMLLKCSFPLIHHKTYRIFFDSKSCCENFSKSKKMLYLVEIRRLVRQTVKLGRLQFFALVECLRNLINCFKMIFSWRKRGNKIESSSIGIFSLKNIPMFIICPFGVNR